MLTFFLSLFNLKLKNKYRNIKDYHQFNQSKPPILVTRNLIKNSTVQLTLKLLIICGYTELSLINVYSFKCFDMWALFYATWMKNLTFILGNRIKILFQTCVSIFFPVSYTRMLQLIKNGIAKLFLSPGNEYSFSVMHIETVEKYNFVHKSGDILPASNEVQLMRFSYVCIKQLVNV